MDTRTFSPAAAPAAGSTGSADLSAAIRLVARGLARRVTISPVLDAQLLIEAALGDAADHGVRLELLVDDVEGLAAAVGILVVEDRDPIDPD